MPAVNICLDIGISSWNKVDTGSITEDGGMTR